MLLLLGACSVGAPVALRSSESDSFAPRPLLLTPDDPPEIPMPERGLGAPLPESPLDAAREAEATATEEAPDASLENKRVNDLFHAVIQGDAAAVAALLDEGVDPDSQLPFPVQEDLLPLFRKDFLHYYATVERGLTPLMVASARGHREIAAVLLERGAALNARTKKHRTTALWLAGYAGQVPVMQLLLGVQPGSVADQTVIEVDLGSQTVRVLRDGLPGETAPISSGRKGFRTPTGEFVVTNKHRQWRSTLYHASMPFYLRLSCRDFGLHAGQLPGYPASHGCIRLNPKTAKALFEEIPIGARVVIE